jgi:hypothetical protein
MAVEIENVMVLSGALTISEEGARWVEWEMPHMDGTPMINNHCGVYRVEFTWTGEGSRDSMVDGTLATFFSHTKGEAEIVFIAENGVLFGLHVKDGAMTWCSVRVTLGDVCDPPVDRWAKKKG